MKTIFTSRFLALACLAMVVLAPSCKKDEPARDKFLGTYSMSDACSETGSATYTITIAESSSDENKILIGNMWLFSNTVSATVDGNSLVITRQEPDGDNYFVQGNGTYSSAGELINLNYTVTDPLNNNDVCQGTLTKQ